MSDALTRQEFYVCMNNSPMNLNSIRQPAPSVGGDDAQVERKFKLPNVGVVGVPTISKTPLGDVLALKKQYKFTLKFMQSLILV